MAKLYKSILLPFLFLVVFSCSEDDPLPMPVVNFFLDPEVAEVGIPVMFDNVTVNAARYEWDFGGIATSTETSPSVTFSDPGTVTVTLRAFTEDEQMVEITRDIAVLERVLTGYIVNVFPLTNGDDPWDVGVPAGEEFADIIIQLLPEDVSNDDGVVDGIFGDVSQGPFGIAVDPLLNKVVLSDEDWNFVLFDFDGDDPADLQPEDVETMIGAVFNPLQLPTFKNDAGDAGFISILLVDNDGNVLDVDLTFELQ